MGERKREREGEIERQKERDTVLAVEKREATAGLSAPILVDLVSDSPQKQEVRSRRLSLGTFHACIVSFSAASKHGEDGCTDN